MIALVVPGIVGLFGLVVGGALLFFSLRARNRLKLIEAAPLCKADQLITGLAKMRGKIVALDEEDLLTSPMTKTVCVFFRFLIQEERTRTVTSYQNGRNVTRTERYWHTLVDDIQAVPTAVQDKTGEALVDLKSAELTLKAMQATSGTFKNVPASLERTLQKRYGVSGKGFIFNKNMRYTESVIEQGAKVFVVGDCKMKKSGTPSFYKGEHPLLVTDKNEEELVGHYKKRFIGFLIGAIAVPLLLFVLGGVIGFFIWRTERAVNPLRANPQVVNQQPNQPAPQGQQNPPPVNADVITPLLTQLQDADWRKRSDAAQQLAKLPVDPARRDEVSRALNPLLEGTNDNNRDQAIQAVKVWGTKENEAALKKLTTVKKGGVGKDAQDALDKLPK